MTNKIDTFLKAINDRMMGALPSDTVKNSKLNIYSTSSVLSAHCYPMEDPQCSSDIHNLINAIKMYEFEVLHLNLPVLEVLAHALMYNAIMDKYVDSLELGKNRSTFIQGEMLEKMKDPILFTLPCRLGNSKPFDTLADLGSCVNLIILYLFKKLKIRLLEETDHVFGLADGTKSYPVGIVKNVEEMDRDDELNPFKDVLVFRRMVEFLGAIPINLKGNMWESEELIEKKIDWNRPPKGGDGA
ncbi:hypothetical protein Tco_1341649 [Tanacetum coccineum]